MKTKIIYSMLATMIISSSCEQEIVGQKIENTPTNNYELLWKDFSEYYGQFEVKNIDWDSINVVTRPLVNDDMNEEEFYGIITNMLSVLNDPHVTLYPTTPDLPRWSIDLDQGVKTIDDFSYDLVKEKYVKQWFNQSGPIQHGLLENNIGYIHIDQFEAGLKNTKKIMTGILKDLQSTNGLVIDIRDTPGGRDPEAQLIASYFTTEKQLYMTSRKKTGPGRNDFSDPLEWYINPMEKLYKSPIVLLTTRYTMSGAETFSLAMKTLDQVVHVGDTTGGAFSDDIMREMYNGWLYAISVGDYRDRNGISYEGRGLPPDKVIENTPEEISQGTDKALELCHSIFEQLARTPEISCL
ncbi:MAG: S41 family peptidase [Cyclobacteriaceae bacterium]|nr:S41 family peptidase [Cyclobacteriaceae bacterium]